MSKKHASTRPSRERQMKDIAIYAVIFMLIASKYAMNVLVSSMQTLPDIKMPLTVLGLIMWAAPYRKHKEPPFKRQCNASGIKEKLTPNAKCSYKVLHSLCLKSRPTTFTLPSGTHTRLAYHQGFSWIEFKQPYSALKNQIFPKLTGHSRFQGFIVWVWCENHSARAGLS